MKLECLAFRFDLETLRYEVIDQRRLPHDEVFESITTPEDCVKLIQSLAIRGAPLIGVTAAVALAQYVAKNSKASTQLIREKAKLLRDSRPTAVNLMISIDRMMKACEGKVASEWIAFARRLFEEDVSLCNQMATAGSSVVLSGESLLTICNTGGLATCGVGTALGAIIKAYRDGKAKHVYVCETRPLLQGARLNTWELAKAEVPFTLITDSMAATLMSHGKVQRVFTGADRVAVNGDFANKIGTYSLAVLADAHKIPFHPVAPETTLDRSCPNGAAIPVEERHSNEVLGFVAPGREVIWAPKTAKVWNPSFDVTPVSLVTSLILNDRVYTRAELQSGALSSQK